MNEHIEIDLEINDGQVDIDLEVDTGVPNYLAMMASGTPIDVNEIVYPLDIVYPYTFTGATIKQINLPNVKDIQGQAFRNATFQQDEVSFDCSEMTATDSARDSFGYATLKSIRLDNVQTLNVYNQAFYKSTVENASMASLVDLRSNLFRESRQLKNVYMPALRISPLRLMESTMVEFIELYATSFVDSPGISEGLCAYCTQLKTLSMPNIKQVGALNGNGTNRTAYTPLNGNDSLDTLYMPSLEKAYLSTSYPFVDGRAAKLTIICLPSLKIVKNGPLTSSISKSKVVFYLPCIEELFQMSRSGSKPDTYNIVIGNQASTSPAVLTNPLFVSTNVTPTTLNIYVPEHLLDEYKTATNWSAYASNMHGHSEIPEDVINDINAKLQPPIPPEEYIEYLAHLGVDYYEERERLTNIEEATA